MSHASLTGEDGRPATNEARHCRKRKDGLLVKAVACHPGEMVSIPGCSPEFLCNVDKVT